jgi:hypothetical protein
MPRFLLIVKYILWVVTLGGRVVCATENLLLFRPWDPSPASNRGTFEPSIVVEFDEGRAFYTPAACFPNKHCTCGAS